MFSGKVQAVQNTKSDMSLAKGKKSTLLCDFQSIPVLDQEAKTGKKIYNVIMFLQIWLPSPLDEDEEKPTKEENFRHPMEGKERQIEELQKRCHIATQGGKNARNFSWIHTADDQ